jgi:hypothetical protein
MRVPSLWDYLFNLIGISVGVATGRVFKVRRFGFLLKGMGLWLSAMIVWFLAQWLYESHVLPFLPRQLNDLFGFTPTTLVDLPGGWLRAWFWIQLFLSGFSFYLLRLALLSLTRPKQNMIFCTSVTYLALLAILWRYHQTHQHIPQHTEFMLIHLLFMVIPPWGAIHQQERKPIWLLGLICSLLVLYVVSIVVPPHPYASPALPSEISRELSNIRGLGIVCTLILPFWLVTLLLIRFFEIKRKKNHVLL